MVDLAARRRRHPEEVAGAAVVVGLVAAVPVALLSLVAPLVVETLRQGGGPREVLEAVAITDGEDWEMIPLFLLGALVIGALTAVVASLVWSFVSARTSSRPSIAHVAAALAAAAVPLLLSLATQSRALALLPPVAAALVALVALPRLGHERTRRSPARVGSSNQPTGRASRL